MKREKFLDPKESALTKAMQLREDAELGRALRWAYETKLYIPLIGFIRKQMIQFLLYNYSHKEKE